MGPDWSLACDGRQPELSTTTLLSCCTPASAVFGTTSTNTSEPGGGRPAGALGSRDYVAVSGAESWAQLTTFLGAKLHVLTAIMVGSGEVATGG